MIATLREAKSGVFSIALCIKSVGYTQPCVDRVCQRRLKIALLLCNRWHQCGDAYLHSIATSRLVGVVGGLLDLTRTRITQFDRDQRRVVEDTCSHTPTSDSQSGEQPIRPVTSAHFCLRRRIHQKQPIATQTVKVNANVEIVRSVIRRVGANSIRSA